MTAPLPAPNPLPERGGVTPAIFAAEIEPGYRPVVMRGLARDWPAVAAARTSDAELARYVTSFDRGTPVEAFLGPAAMQGRYFYTDDMRGFNFERRKGPLAGVFDFLLRSAEDPAPPCFYVGATPVPEALPGFDTANPMTLFGPGMSIPRAWIGNRSTVTTHFDVSDNIAVVAAGRRRFTLFPPEQLANLYVGPLDHTMAGQPASMVSLHDPDLERFPRFAEAMGAAMSAELEPGDAIYIPSLWWHHVEALAPVNLLVNYWVDPPADEGSPFDAMIHGIFAIAALPAPRRAAWRSFFDHYVFRPEHDPAEHLAPEHRGILAEQTPELREKLRLFLLRHLSGR
ncbi:cupin-like domain-containing protein [Sphingomonas sp. LB-2]|uniref:cupin-like domain-containing protein n=1 Tax=Sphingomonas caeni TaxID=2984949 RepID=UPI00222F4777|nr:cupin-like domain-containing protein [Sphingomonas caeni]MCW3847411.1 cupin-like domain-containing protein [Sphingomonas caeni]